MDVYYVVHVIAILVALGIIVITRWFYIPHRKR